MLNEGGKAERFFGVRDFSIAFRSFKSSNGIRIFIFFLVSSSDVESRYLKVVTLYGKEPCKPKSRLSMYSSRAGDLE